MILVGLACAAMACVGLSQIYGFARCGVARVPMTLWRVQGPFELDRRGEPIKFWAAIFGIGFFYGLLGAVGITAIMQGIGK